MRSLVLCPTRGRPGESREAYQSFLDTKALDDTEMLFVVDDDDPKLDAYKDAGLPVLIQPAPGSMVKALNEAALWALDMTGAQYLGFIGDDHRFRTKGWDEAFANLLDERGGGMVYGNDGYWVNGDIPTQIFMSASIVKALGWMGLPTCHHLYIDNAWRVLGEATSCLFYMPDVVIEHMHPAAGKGEWSEGHKRVNTTAMYSRDGTAFSTWANGMARLDIERVAKALGRAVPA